MYTHKYLALCTYRYVYTQISSELKTGTFLSFSLSRSLYFERAVAKRHRHKHRHRHIYMYTYIYKSIYIYTFISFCVHTQICIHTYTCQSKSDTLTLNAPSPTDVSSTNFGRTCSLVLKYRPAVTGS